MESYLLHRDRYVYWSTPPRQCSHDEVVPGTRAYLGERFPMADLEELWLWVSLRNPRSRCRIAADSTGLTE